MTDVPVSHLEPLARAVGGVEDAWLSALGGAFPSAVADDDVDGMSDAGLLAVNEALAVMGRRVQALQARIANGISKRSAPEKGPDGLAKKAGFKSPEKLIAATTGGHPGEAKKLIQVGDATAGRMTLTGERAPARHPYVAAAVEAGTLSVAGAGAIATVLDKVAYRSDRAVLADAEKTLVAQAVGLSLAELLVVLRRAEGWLDPDGLEPKIEALRDARYLKIWEDRHGMITMEGRFDPATGAPIKAAVDALVTAQIRASRGQNHPGDAAGSGEDGAWAWGGAQPGVEPGAGAGPVEQRTIPQLQADAMSTIAKVALSADQTVAPLASTTVVVRIPLDALETGTGVATIDGITQPIDVGTARRMAADAEIIPLVLGADSETLDYGRSRRLFTRAQRLALVERDGGCAGCGAPPGMTEAHHLTWWSSGGRTDLSNGILLCSSCHHTVHRDDWEIRIDGADVWFTPPAHIDPARTPRPGGRRRFDHRPQAQAV